MWHRLGSWFAFTSLLSLSASLPTHPLVWCVFNLSSTRGVPFIAMSTARLAVLSALLCAPEPCGFGLLSFQAVWHGHCRHIIPCAPFDWYPAAPLSHPPLLVHSKWWAWGKGQNPPAFMANSCMGTATTRALCPGAETPATLLCYIDHLLNL